jgi:glycerol-3-phosphate acyltransferase PlsY
MLSNRPVAYACAAATVLGHVFPITRKFKGGKGVATGAGSLFPLHPILLIGAAMTWLLVTKATKKASIASIATVPALVVAFVVSGIPGWEIFALVCIGALVEIRHASNIKRLLSGTEPPVTGSTV